MKGTRPALVLGAIPIVVGLVYFLLQETRGTPLTLDMAGALLLVSLGAAMAFGVYVLVNGARDL
jgi:Flp pilus assembly protein TadB